MVFQRVKEEHFLKHPAMPYVECRYSENSRRSYKPHMHRTFSVGAADHGEVIYKVDGEAVKLQPGSLALINPETLHSCNPSGPNKRNYYVLYLDVGWCLQLQQSMWRIDIFRPVNTILLKDNSLYQEYILTMETLMGEGTLLEKEEMLAKLVENIFLNACDSSASIIEPSLRIEQVKEQLGHHLDMDITLRKLSADLQVNSYTLLRQFKATTGITPHAYRLNCRIEHAKQLIQNGVDLAQVAQECGFFDQSHLNRCFKSITAVTPKEYRVNFIQ